MANTIASVNAEHLWIDWDSYHQAIEALALLIHHSQWTFDQILCLARGGLRPGDVLSRIFDVPLAILSASSYVENAGTQRGELSIAPALTLARGDLVGRILLVDDLVDSGITLRKVQRYLEEKHPSVKEVRSAVIWRKQSCTVAPDYCLHTLAGDPWIHQPFEHYDSMTPEQLSMKTEAKIS